jgi:hypothetical protein
MYRDKKPRKVTKTSFLGPERGKDIHIRSNSRTPAICSSGAGLICCVATCEEVLKVHVEKEQKALFIGQKN